MKNFRSRKYSFPSLKLVAKGNFRSQRENNPFLFICVSFNPKNSVPSVKGDSIMETKRMIGELSDNFNSFWQRAWIVKGISKTSWQAGIVLRHRLSKSVHIQDQDQAVVVLREPLVSHRRSWQIGLSSSCRFSLWKEETGSWSLELASVTSANSEN